MAGFRPWTLLPWAVVGVLFYLAFRQTSLEQILTILRHLTAAQVGLLLLMSLIFLLLLNFRWWVLLRTFGYSVSLTSLAVYRLAGFSVSYFTPGPQLGGEPVQVHLLHVRKGIPLGKALSSVFLDRLVDVLANFTFLFVISVILLFGGPLRTWLPSGAWFMPMLLLLFPVGHLVALRLGARPATLLVNRIRWAALKRIHPLIYQSEEEIANLIIDRPLIMVSVLFISALTWVGAVFEFWLALRFLGIQAGLVEAVAALFLVRMAFLVPVPGGLGALESSLIIASQSLGWSPAAGIAVSLVIRARDVFFALIGAGLGLLAYRSYLFTSFMKEKRR